MKTITACYNQICAQKYKPLGFSKYKTTFVRLKGDLIQSFTLKRFFGNRSCTVEFGIIPLCVPQPVFLDAGIYEVGKLSLELPNYHSEWAYDRNSEESMIHCIESLSHAIDLYILPFFDACCDCETALTEVMKLEELAERVRQERLRLMGATDKAAPWQERSMFDGIKYFLALKSHNWSFAHRYLIHQINYFTVSLKSFDDPDSPRQPDGVRERFLDGWAEYSEELRRLESGDFAYFDEVVKSNERQMQEFLAAKYPKVYKG